MVGIRMKEDKQANLQRVDGRTSHLRHAGKCLRFQSTSKHRCEALTSWKGLRRTLAGEHEEKDMFSRSFFPVENPGVYPAPSAPKRRVGRNSTSGVPKKKPESFGSSILTARLCGARHCNDLRKSILALSRLHYLFQQPYTPP